MKKINLVFLCTSGYRASLASSYFENNEDYECISCGVYSDSPEKLKEYFSSADKIVCITDEHFAFVERYFKEYKNKIIRLSLSDYANEEEIARVSKEKVSSSLK